MAKRRKEEWGIKGGKRGEGGEEKVAPGCRREGEEERKEWEEKERSVGGHMERKKGGK